MAFELMLNELEQILAFTYDNHAPLGRRERESIIKTIRLAKLSQGTPRVRPVDYDKALDDFASALAR
jgi:hypothetical protein